MPKKINLSPVFAALLVGCASFPGDIEPFPHSSIQYETASCAQIGADIARLSPRAEKLTREIRSAARNDIWQIMVGVVFWPMLFFLGDEDDFRVREYADITGRLAALDMAAGEKGCPRSAAEKPAAQKPKGQD